MFPLKHVLFFRNLLLARLAGERMRSGSIEPLPISTLMACKEKEEMIKHGLHLSHLRNCKSTSALMLQVPRPSAKIPKSTIG